MKATTESKPDVIIRLTWEEAKAVSDYLGEVEGHKAVYNLYVVLSNIIDDGQTESERC